MSAASSPETLPAAIRAGPGAVACAALLALFLAIHLLVRLALSSSLHQDEADVVFFNQALAWGYSEQAPLYSWLFWIWSGVFGVSLFSLALLRVSLLAATIVLIFVSARRVLQRAPLALLAACSVLVLANYIWHCLNYLTHSLLLGLLCVATFYFLVRVVQDGKWGDYLGLGVAAALGVLSKYNYAFFLGALVLASLTVRSVRRRFLGWRAAVALALAAAIVVPHALWLVGHWDLMADIYGRKADADTAVYYLGVVPGGVPNIALYAAFPVVCFGVVYFFLRAKATPSADAPAELQAYRQLLWRSFLVLVVLLVLYAFASGAGRIRRHWLEPFFLLAPVLLACHLAPARLRPERVRCFCAALALVAIGLTVGRGAQLWFGSGKGGQHLANVSFASVAGDLGAVLGPDVAVVTHNSGIAGNLCFHLPHLRCLSINNPAYCPASALRAKQFILLWDVDEGEDEPRKLVRFVESAAACRLHVRPQVRRIEIPPRVPGKPALRLALREVSRDASGGEVTVSATQRR